MAMRSVEFVGKAEGIKSHELSVKSLMEKLSGTLSSLKGQKRSLQSELSSLYAELSAAESDTDEDGEPDYGLIASIENQIDWTNEELSETEGEISQTSGELQRAQQEYAEVEEEKQQTLFEIQERARITSQDASKASGMFGAWASVGASLNQSFQANFDALAQAASILDGNVSAASAQTSSGGGGGSRTGGGIGIAVATGAAAIASSGMIASTKPMSANLGSRQISGANSLGGRFQYAKGGNANHKGPQLSSTQNSGTSVHSSVGASVGVATRTPTRNSLFETSQSSHSSSDSGKSSIDRSSTERRLGELAEIRKLLTEEDGVLRKASDIQHSEGSMPFVELGSAMSSDLSYSRVQNINEYGNQLNNTGVIAGIVADIIAAKGVASFSIPNAEPAKTTGEKIKTKAKEFFSSAFSKQSKFDKTYTRFHHLYSNEVDAQTHDILCKTALSLVASEFSDILSKKQLQEAAKNIYLLSDEEIVNKYPDDSPETLDKKLHSGGFYQNGEVVVRKDTKAPFLKLMSTYLHEILHMSSDDSVTPHEGFLEYRNGKIRNRGINEGATELLALQILEKNGYEMFARSYGPLVDIAEKMQSIIGKDAFKDLYKKKGLQSTRNDYDYCFTKGEFNVLLDDIDRVHDTYPSEDNSLKMSIMQRLEEYEKRKNDSDYRFRKKLEDKGVTASIKQSVKGTGVDPALGQKVRAKGYEKVD